MKLSEEDIIREYCKYPSSLLLPSVYLRGTCELLRTNRQMRRDLAVIGCGAERAAVAGLVSDKQCAEQSLKPGTPPLPAAAAAAAGALLRLALVTVIVHRSHPDGHTSSKFHETHAIILSLSRNVPIPVRGPIRRSPALSTPFRNNSSSIHRPLLTYLPYAQELQDSTSPATILDTPDSRYSRPTHPLPQQISIPMSTRR